VSQIQDLTQINYIIVIIGFFTLLFAFKEAIEIFSYFKKKFRIKIGTEEDKETIEDRIATLEKHDKWQYNEISKISKGIDGIQEQLLHKDIEDMRKTILDFCSILSNGQKPNNEAFMYIFNTHKRYDDVLKEHNLKNDVINESMKFISEMYQKRLHNGL
jgi:hypothetical protein